MLSWHNSLDFPIKRTANTIFIECWSPLKSHHFQLMKFMYPCGQENGKGARVLISVQFSHVVLDRLCQKQISSEGFTFAKRRAKHSVPRQESARKCALYVSNKFSNAVVVRWNLRRSSTLPFTAMIFINNCFHQVIAYVINTQLILEFIKKFCAWEELREFLLHYE